MKRQFLVDQRIKAKNGEGQITCGGFALVTVLLLASLLLVMLVGLLSMSSEEGQRAEYYVEGEQSRGYVEVALAEVKAKLMDGGEVPYREGVARASMAASPGLLEVRRYDVLPNRGYQVGREAFSDPNSFFRKPFAREYERSGEGDWQPANPRWIALYSQKWYAPLCKYRSVEGDEVRDVNVDYNPERVFDLNREDNPFRPGRLYFGGVGGESAGMKSVALGGEYAVRGRENKYWYRAGESSVERPVYVQWIPVYADARYGAVKPGGQNNPIVGRYAYWVDVENTKININEVKREWEETALGRLTGLSDAERSRGSYYRQRGEGRGDTERYEAERYLPRSYRLFRDEVDGEYGVELSYRVNYGRVRGEDRSGEFYRERVLGWEDKRVPPAIADGGVIDSEAFSGLVPHRREGGGRELGFGGEVWGGGMNMVEEVYSMLDPAVERRERVVGEERLLEMEKMYGQVYTVYGWEEERDPLGRAKLDINEILREGDELFDRGFGLPEGDHEGSELEQLIARTEDGRYYGAYYPGGYGSGGGEGKSLVDSLSVFAGRGMDAGRYGRAMRDQMLVNVIEYGREERDPPYMDRGRGIVGAKSMPYVGEVAIRVRNGIWGAWNDFDAREELEEMSPSERNEASSFKGLFPGTGDFDEWDEDAWQRFAQRIYDSLFKNIVETDPNIMDKPEIPPTRSMSQWPKIDGKNLGGMLASVLADGALALVNPNPLSKKRGESGEEWEIELGYSWYDAVTAFVVQQDWDGSGNISYWPLWLKNLESEFYEADGSQRRLMRKIARERHYQPSLLPGINAQVDHRGYFFPEKDASSQHHLVYFRPGSGYLPGEGFFSNDRIFFQDSYLMQNIFQPFRLWGWRIYRRERGQRRGLFHEVPMRHPGQKSVPRLWWQMSVGDANAGVVGSRIGSRHYADLHSLAHFQQSKALVNGVGREQLGVPFGLGLSAGALVRSQEMELEKRKDVATSWFSSLTMAEFRQQCESLLKQMPKRLEITVDLPEVEDFKEHSTSSFRKRAAEVFSGTLELSLSDKGFYHIHEEPNKDLSGLEGYLYLNPMTVNSLRSKINNWRTREYSLDKGLSGNTIKGIFNEPTISGRMEEMGKALSDLIYFIMLQLSVRDEGMHEGGRERSQEFTGRSGEDGFKEGVAMVERIVCIDPVLGHRTGNPDLRINREGKEYRGHFYGMNGHGWRRHHYYFYHYDKEVMEEQLGLKRPEPDRSLSYHFRDPRRCDGSIEYEPEDHRGGEGYVGYSRERVPLYGVTGSVLMDAVLTRSGDEEPYLGGELGWSRVSEVEGDGVRVWPYMRGMNIDYGYGDRESREGGIGSRRERLAYRKGSYLTHSVRGGPMVSIGELGMCHSGFLQRVIDLGRPPMASVSGVKRLGSVQHGPPLSMLLDLVVSSNFRDEEGNYLSREQWERGDYQKHSPENPRVGRWSVNCQWAHDNYVGVREGAHGELSDGEEIFYTEEMRGEWVHPVLVPNGVWGGSGGEQRRGRVQGVGGDGEGVMDPYLRPGISVRRGWEHWLGVIVGDYSPNRNLGRGVWEKEREGLGEAYDIAQGTLNCVPLLGGRGLVYFGGGAGYRGGSRLLVLGREVRGRERGVKRRELGGHVSADGPAVGSVGAYELVGRGAGVSLYDVTRYGLYPLCHHISEVGYSGLGEVHTALNPKSATTESQGGYWGEEKLVEEGVGGDGMLGAMSQAGFARNSAWVLSGNQMSTSANVYKVHIVTQSLRDGGGRRSKEQEARRKKSLIPDSQSPVTGLGYMDEWDEVLGEQWAQVVVARVPRRGRGRKISQDKHGAPQYDYRILSQEVLQNPR